MQSIIWLYNIHTHIRGDFHKTPKSHSNFNLPLALILEQSWTSSPEKSPRHPFVKYAKGHRKQLPLCCARGDGSGTSKETERQGSEDVNRRDMPCSLGRYMTLLGKRASLLGARTPLGAGDKWHDLSVKDICIQPELPIEGDALRHRSGRASCECRFRQGTRVDI